MGGIFNTPVSPVTEGYGVHLTGTGRGLAQSRSTRYNLCPWILRFLASIFRHRWEPVPITDQRVIRPSRPSEMGSLGVQLGGLEGYLVHGGDLASSPSPWMGRMVPGRGQQWS